MPHPIVHGDTSTIRAGKLAKHEDSLQHLAAFVEANVPQLISHSFFLDEARARMTVVAVHPDAASLEFHLDAGSTETRDSRTRSIGRRSRSTAASAIPGRRGCSGEKQ